jgi:hypothetical protein
MAKYRRIISEIYTEQNGRVCRVAALRAVSSTLGFVENITHDKDLKIAINANYCYWLLVLFPCCHQWRRTVACALACDVISCRCRGKLLAIANHWLRDLNTRCSYYGVISILTGDY